MLEKLARALKPGGLLLVFDSGGAPPVSMQQPERFDRFGGAIFQAASKSGWDLGWAPSLPQRLSALGLEDVRAYAFREFVRGSSGGFTGFVAESTERLRDRLLATGLIEAAESTRPSRCCAIPPRVPHLRMLYPRRAAGGCPPPLSDP